MRWFGLAAGAIVASLALVACSGSNSPAEGGDASTATAPAPAEETPTAPADEPEAGSTEPAGDDPDGVQQVTAAKPKVYWIHTDW